jgi:hypothetical protein
MLYWYENEDSDEDIPDIHHSEHNNGEMLIDIPSGEHQIDYCFGGWKYAEVEIEDGIIKTVDFFDVFGGTDNIDYNTLHPFYQGLIFANLIRLFHKDTNDYK